MNAAATKIFDFLSAQDTFVVDRRVVSLIAFGELRHSIRKLVMAFLESDDADAVEISDGLRTRLSEWLTVPVPFNQEMLEVVVEVLGNSDAVLVRWGSDIRRLYDSARAAIDILQRAENPVRSTLRSAFTEMALRAKPFKIYCHRRARPHFESILTDIEGLPSTGGLFLHSPRDYENTDPFDTLVKVGPLRARGWGSAPDAVISAPRFATLLQAVWSSCADDPDFGYDPASPREWSGAQSDSPGNSDERHETSGGSHAAWAIQVTRSGEAPPAVTDLSGTSDELAIFSKLRKIREGRSAVLVQVDAMNGILYGARARVLSFDPDPAAREPIAYRIPIDSLREGMFVVMPRIAIDLGGVRAQHGHYSQIWKLRLQAEWRRAPNDLIARLKAAGLDLVHLGPAIEHWCGPPTSVIPAPQKIRHFEMLLRVLGIDEPSPKTSSQHSIPTWKLAWNEIRHSRGEAIQTGFLEQEIAEKELLEVLLRLLPEVRRLAQEHAGFFLELPVGCGIEGMFLFHFARGLEEGFTAPDADLKVVRPLGVIDRWRD